MIILFTNSMTDFQHYLLILFDGETFCCLVCHQHLLSAPCMRNTDEMPEYLEYYKVTFWIWQRFLKFD